MKIFAVLAVDINADYPYHPEIVSYHMTIESARLKADNIDREYEDARSRGWYEEGFDENGNMYSHHISRYQSTASIHEIEVLE